MRVDVLEEFAEAAAGWTSHVQSHIAQWEADLRASLRESKAEWYRANRARLVAPERLRSQRRRHRDKLRAYKRRYAQEHRDQVAAYKSAWAAANRDKMRAASQRYYERRKDDPEFRARRRAIVAKSRSRGKLPTT